MQEEALGPEEWVFRNYDDIISAGARRRMRLVRLLLTGHIEVAVGHSWDVHMGLQLQGQDQQTGRSDRKAARQVGVHDNQGPWNRSCKYRRAGQEHRSDRKWTCWRHGVLERTMQDLHTRNPWVVGLIDLELDWERHRPFWEGDLNPS